MKVSESIVEECMLEWLDGLGYEVPSGLAIALGELRVPAATKRMEPTT